jgi:hypothetical protein
MTIDFLRWGKLVYIALRECAASLRPGVLSRVELRNVYIPRRDDSGRTVRIESNEMQKSLPVVRNGEQRR